jgi:hypothetical protein
MLQPRRHTIGPYKCTHVTVRASMGEAGEAQEAQEVQEARVSAFRSNAGGAPPALQLRAYLWQKQLPHNAK